MKKIIIPKNIVTVNNENEILKNNAILVEDGLIKEFIPINNLSNISNELEIHNYENYTLVPGFVQTHIHLCQTLFRGLADDLELLDWLQKRIFPFENSHDKNSLRISAQLGINELLKGGTTTILDMGTLHHQEIIFEELIKSGIRAFAGNCMIDRNDLYPSFSESTKWNLENTYQWAKNFHNSSNGKIKFGFAPRFVLSCSEELLIETKEMMKEFEGSLYHTHSSENKKEVETVRNLTGKDNVEYFDSIKILDDKTVLAHCIHLSDEEISLLKNNNSRVSHCPSSNLKLGSGIANIPKLMKNNISISLGADGAPCNNSLSIFKEMHLAALIQKPIHGPTSMDALTVFRLATIEGAKALHLDNEIGSIEIGKKADFVLLDLNKNDQPINADENIYSSIVYSADKSNVKAVFINGEIIYDNNSKNIYDENELSESAKIELKKLIERA
ncbi:MAG: amidohydrolase family protein [Melioribacteraceae bacterium]|nr:amidohydrolase family protein [Melioribacteraceae bacterium]